jgi:hypothetical protein
MFLSLPLLSSAQGLRFTVLANPQFSWMVADVKNATSQGALLGINTGIGMDYYFAENYAFSTGVSINNTGGKIQYEDTVSFMVSTGNIDIPPLNTVTYKLQYINIPFGLKFKTNEIGYVTYFANMGVTPMITIRQRASDVSGLMEKDNISEDIEPFNMNYFINIGMQYSIGGSSAIIGGIGYSSGFVDVTTRSTDKITINTFSINLGLLF